MATQRTFVDAAVVIVASAALHTLQASRTTQTDRKLASALVRAEDAVPTRGPWGEWRRHFRGDTHGVKDLIVLAVHLKPGQEPHPPHRHAEEELMFLTEGAGTWHLDGKEFPGKKGDVVYAAPWSMHGVKNTGDGPLTYYMVKWSGKGAPAPAKPAVDEAEEAALAKLRALGGKYRRDLEATRPLQ
jgi:mannose-6-phosphate isomerase-like protein (cupin superfamily)